ncbi:MAG TPA: hypothetical protein VHI77_04185 [Solirubrobacterales bacterium]|jgi:hypothetical protein|nr:hypothetical protein [Solirubrobacterales bacterium]
MRGSTSRRPILLLLAAVAFLSGCGQQEQVADSAQIDQAIQTAALVHAPSDCIKVATVGFLEQVTGERGRRAVLTCEEEAEDPLGRARQVQVSKVKVEGHTASAEANFRGLPGIASLRRETVSISLVRGGATWKLDRLLGYRHRPLDRAALETDLAKKSEPFERRCRAGRDATTSVAEAEQAILASPFSGARTDAQYGVCSRLPNGDDGRRVAPAGSAFSFRLPAGSALFPVPAYKGTSITAVQFPEARNSSAGILVTPLEGVDLRSAHDLREFGTVSEELTQEEVGSKGSRVSPVREIAVAGQRAVRYSIVGGRGQSAPGIDEERIVVMPGDGADAVEVTCRWGRVGAEKRLIRRGCMSLLDSLRIG